MVAVDANFRLKRRARSSSDRDPDLGSGWGYFVEDSSYREHVLKYADQHEVRDAGYSILIGLTYHVLDVIMRRFRCYASRELQVF